jgi:ankyrin repeat protein
MILDDQQVKRRLLRSIVCNADLDDVEMWLMKSMGLRVDLNDVWYEGQSLVHLCCLYNRLDLLKMLVECGGCDVQRVNGDGWLPVHVAVYLGHMPIVVYLLQQSTHIDWCDYFTQSSPVISNRWRMMRGKIVSNPANELDSIAEWCDTQ